MNEIAPDTLTVLPDPRLFRAARWTQRICLGVAAVAILFGLMPLFGTEMSVWLAAGMRGSLLFLLTALLCGISLLLAEPGWTWVAVSYARSVVNFFVICGAAALIFAARVENDTGSQQNAAFPPAGLTVGFAALAIAVVLVDKRNWLLNRLEDVLVCGLCLLGLLLVSDAVFGRFALFGGTADNQGWTALLLCLLALTIVVTLHQAEHGVFSIFLGVGVGSNLARVFAPILLLLPFAWETMNVWMNRVGPGGHLNAALLASCGVGVAVGILLFFAWRISALENEIHDLILRDEATRLYNVRGFHMLAEHALRLAQRSNIPFSVLFIDLENLSQIHAQLGQDASTASLAEAGELLRATFRESDIKGRIDGDKFAVAGRFDRAGISVAALRLEASAAACNAKSARAIPLKFSMGHVTSSETNEAESLKELLERAGRVRNRQDNQLTEMRVN